MPGLVKQRKVARFNDHFAAFSLVEMMVVMGILVILLVVTVPAFRGLNQSSAKRAAVNNLMGMLDRARTMAVSDGKATYVAFYASRNPPTGAVTDSTNGPWGRAYAIYQDKDNISFVPEQKTAWTYLPTGIAFKVESGQTASVTCVPGDTDFPVTSSFSTASPSTVRLPYWKFDPTGAVDELSLNAANAGGGNTATYLRVLMFPGALKADGSEAGVQAGAAGGTLDPNVLEEIDVNPVTGRARYVVNSADNLVTPTPTPQSSPKS